MASDPIKLLIGLPIYAQVPAFFLQSLLALQAAKPLRTPDGREIQIEIRMCQGDGVARSRNQLTADFLAGGHTHLLFIDCDLIFSAQHVARIVSHDEPVVGGLYPKKQEGPIEWVLNSLADTFPDARGLQSVRYLGTGFLCIRRDVIEQMIAALPDTRFTADYGSRRVEHDLWPMGVYQYPDGNRRYLSEDWFFCQRWLDLGGTILADTRVILKHLGPAIYPTAEQEAELIRSLQTEEDPEPVPGRVPGRGSASAFRREVAHASGAPDGRADLCIGRPAVPQLSTPNPQPA